MNNSKDGSDGLVLTDRATLDLLSVLEFDAQVSQRSLALRIGIALGMTNALLKRAIRKGLIKVQQAPAKRYAYYVTPKGFSEKSRLAAEYVSSSLTFFRQVREEYSDVFRLAHADGRRKVALFGVGELAEIANLSAQDLGLDVLGVVAPGSDHEFFCDRPVYPSFDVPQLSDVDAVIIADAEAPQKAYDLLLQIMPDSRIYTASLLHVRRVPQEVQG